MEFEEVRPFLESNHRGVVNTLQSSGAIQTSVVVCGSFRENIAFVSVRGNSAKVRNLRRDPRCSVLVVTADWRSYVVVEGQARILNGGNTESEELRILLREVYRACGGGEHPDWEEYDRAMLQQDAAVVLIHPERTYGLVR